MSQKQISPVIPAKAGIQQNNNSAQRTKLIRGSATRIFINQLDSRLRGNDAVLV